MTDAAKAINGALAGAILQKAWADNAGCVCLKLRLPGRTALLLLSSRRGTPGAGVVEKRPPMAATPPALAAYLRAHAEGGRLFGAAGFGARGVALFFDGTGGRITLALDGDSSPARLFMADGSGAAKVSERWDGAGGALRPGATVAGLPETRDGVALGAEMAWAFLSAEGAKIVEGQAGESEAEAKKYVGRWRKKLARRIENIRRDLDGAPDPDGLRRLGDALAASLHLAKKGRAEADLPDPADPSATLRVELDERLTPGANLASLYRAARRAARTREIAGERLAEAIAELEGPEPGAVASKGKAASHGGGGGPYRRYRSSDGWLILVGRNRVENDRLLKEAKPWDLWLHAKDGAGAHVVVKKPGRDGEPPERTLLEAAGLAAAHSQLAGEKYVEVTVVEAGRVRKPKGAGPGKVLLTGGKTLRATPGAGNPVYLESRSAKR